jgi:hypothetical protein
MEDSPLTVLRRFAKPRAAAHPVAPERCELCRAVLPASHRHLLEVASRQVICACDPCALRFEGIIGGRFKLIPRDPRALPGFRLSDAQWANLAIPIGLAFFFFSTPAGKMTAMYPSPAGATESLLPLTAWEELVSENPPLGRMEPDTEALLVNRLGPTPSHYVVPIDACYELVGLIRLYWRGLSGGDDLWREIGAFFARLERQAGGLQEGARA